MPASQTTGGHTHMLQLVSLQYFNEIRSRCTVQAEAGLCTGLHVLKPSLADFRAPMKKHRFQILALNV